MGLGVIGRGNMCFSFDRASRDGQGSRTIFSSSKRKDCPMNMQLTGRLTVVLLLVSLAGTGVVSAEAVPEKWKSMDVQALKDEAWKLVVKQPFVEGNIELLAGYTAQRYAAASAAGKLKISEWMILASYVGKHLPAATRAAMIQEIEKRIVPDREAISKLSYHVCKRASWTLTHLGSDKGHAALATWVEETGALPSAKPQDLVGLARDMASAGSFGKKARIRLLKLIAPKYTASEAAIRSLPPRVWAELIFALDAELTAEMRRTWPDKLYSAFSTDASLAKMDFETCRGFAYLLDRMLRPKKGKAFVVLWGGKTDALGSIRPDALGFLAGHVLEAGDAGKAGRVRLAAHIKAKYMTDSTAVRSIQDGQWLRLAECLGDVLDENARSTWIGKLYTALIAEQDPSVPVDQRTVFRTIERLGGKGDPGGFLVATVVGGDTWKSWRSEVLIDVCMRLSKLGDKGQAALARLVKHVEAKYFETKATTASVSCGQWWDFARYLAKTLSADSRKLWIGKLRLVYVDDAEAFGKLKAAEATALGRALGVLGDKNSDSVVAKWVSSH